MNHGAYSLVRTIPDPIRGEVFNIGIVAWGEEFIQIRIDEDAARRAANQSRYLAKDAWTHYENFLRELLIENGTLKQTTLEEFATCPHGETLRLTAPKFLRFPDGEHGFNERVQEILKRLVLPIHRGGGAGSPSRYIRTRLKPFIDRQAIQQNYGFTETRSSVQRSCEFFVNSGSNVALDTLRLDLKDVNTVYERIDAEATKISDVITPSNIRFYVYCQPASGEGAGEIEDRARKVLTSVNAIALLDPEAASEVLEQAAERQFPELLGLG